MGGWPGENVGKDNGALNGEVRKPHCPVLTSEADPDSPESMAGSK